MEHLHIDKVSPTVEVSMTRRDWWIITKLLERINDPIAAAYADVLKQGNWFDSEDDADSR